MTEAHDPIVVAIDVADSAAVDRLADSLAGRVRTLKIGLECFVWGGPELVRSLRERGFDIFLDLKLHDIPHQVAGAVRAAAALDVAMLTLHVSGGRAMLRAAAEARESASPEGRPLLLGVTALTSLAVEDLTDIGVARPVDEHVAALTELARDSGLDGVVCSAAEVAEVRRKVGGDFVIVTPGIRPPGTEAADQRRLGIPAQALEDGSNYLVIGRPITGAVDPTSALEAIREGIGWFDSR